MPEEGIIRALKWEESSRGQHIELGISENNLFIMLGQLGVSFETSDELLFPIGTVYDPFIRRGLDAFVYSVVLGRQVHRRGYPVGDHAGAGGRGPPVDRYPLAGRGAGRARLL